MKTKTPYHAIVWVNLLLLLLMSACSGGGGGDEEQIITPKPNLVSGAVTAPGGAIAALQTKPLLAHRIVNFLIADVSADFSGVAPVANAAVELIQIDANGDQVGDAVETTTTNATGEFTINTALNLSTSLVVRVSGGSGTTMRAFVTGTSTNVNPASEYVVGKIMAAVQAQADVDMTDFTTQELLDMLLTINNQNIDLTGSNISEALNIIEANVGTAIDTQIAEAIGPSTTVSVRVIIERDDDVIGTFPANDGDLQVKMSLLQNGITKTALTDASGIAVFDNVSSDPATITGELDLDLIAEKTRFATTVHDLNLPASGEVGFVLITDDETDLISEAGTSITGQITNIPAPPNEFYYLLVFAESRQDCGNAWTTISFPVTEPVQYTINNDNISGCDGLGSGDYTVFAGILTNTGPSFESTLGFTTAVHPNLVNVTGGIENSSVDIDFANSATRIDFVNKDVTVNNYSATANDEFSIGTTVTFPGLNELWFGAFSHQAGSGDFTVPTTASLVSSAPANVKVEYHLSVDDDDEERGVAEPFSASSSVIFTLTDSSIVSTPVPGQQFTVSAAENMTIAWTDTNAIPPSFRILVIGSDNNMGFDNIGSVFWAHFISPENSSVMLPPTQTRMFGDNADYFLYLSREKYQTTLDFHSLFDLNIQNNLGELDMPPYTWAARKFLLSTLTP